MNKVEHYVQPSAGNPHAWLGWSALCWGDLLRRTLVLALAGFACTTCVAVEYFVRQNGGDDSYDGKAADWDGEHGPKQSIQAAVSQSDATIVTVYPGRYTRGDAETVDQFGCAVCVSIDKALTLRSANGRNDTFIVGKHAEDNNGVGPGAVRCVEARVSGIVIDGFTICDGASPLLKTASGEGRYAGGIYANASGVYVNDCAITNCIGWRGGAVAYGNYERCLFAYNKATGDNALGSVGQRGYFRNCAVYKNSGVSFGYPQGFMNCAFLNNGGNVLSTHNSGTIIVAYNCVFLGNGGVGTANYAYSNCVFNVAQSKVGGAGNSACVFEVGLSQFINPAADDWRVCRGAEAETAGNAAWFSKLGFGGRQFTDYTGNAITVTEGAVCAGPCQTAVNPSVQMTISATRGGGVTVTGAKVGVNTVKTGGIVEVTAVETNRLFIGWRVNGVMAPESNRTYSYRVTGLEEGALSVEAAYSDAWYVDAVNGNDVDNDGCTPETPKKTLAAILSVPGLLSGEVVHAAPGEYKTGTMPLSDDCTVAFRACVPEGVTLLADAGPEDTFIIGSQATQDVAGDYGLGPNAVRCVKLAKNARVEGFTLTGGRTNSSRDETDGFQASAVHGDSHLTCFAANCIITGNVAYSASLMECHAVNCRIFDNHATYRRAVGYNMVLSGCVVDRNTSDYPIEYFYGVRNCTIGPNNSKPALYYRRTASVDDPSVINTLVLASGSGAVWSDVAATNSVFVKGCGVNANLLGACIVTNAAALQVDSNLIPVIGSNVAVDKGDVSLYNAARCGDVDVYGTQRVFNGAMDIGAAEASWLARYSADLGGHGIAVTNATPAVVETDAGNVAIPEGRIDLEWSNPQANSMNHVVPVSVTGTGVLTVLLGGETLGSVTRADGDVELAFSSASAVNGLSFVYVPGEDDDGAAVVGVLKRLVGLHVILR